MNFWQDFLPKPQPNHNHRMNLDTRHKDQAADIDYHSKTGWRIIRSKIAPVIFATQKSTRTPDAIIVKAWSMSKRAADWHYLFKTHAAAEKACNELVESVRSRIERKAKDAAEKKAKKSQFKAADFWAVNDVVYTSWGYDQTNVEYFQITAVLPKSVKVRQISVNCSDHGGPSGGKIQPRRFEFVGPEYACPCDEQGRFTAGPCWNDTKPQWRHNAYKWDGKAKYCSSYA